MLLVALILAATAGLACEALPPLPGAKPAPFNGGVLTPPLRLPELTLQRADGQPLSTADLHGRTSLVFFGYTLCPDVCPLTLAQVAQVRQELGARAAHLDAYFVTVDPERDTPERLGEYLRHFDPAIVGLTGTAEELERAQRAFGMVAQKRVLAESAAGYFMDHTAAIFLVGPQADIRMLYPHNMPPREIVADLQRLLPR